MNTLVSVTHDLKNGLLEATLEDENGIRVHCHNYGMAEMDEFRIIAGENAQKYFDLAGWSPEALVKLQAKIAKKVAEDQAIADAEQAELKAKKDKADKDAFDADVARQVAILEAAKAIVDEKK